MLGSWIVITTHDAPGVMEVMMMMMEMIAIMMVMMMMMAMRRRGMVEFVEMPR